MDKLEQDDFDDLAWGRQQIGEAIGRSPSQVSYLLKLGVLDGAVRRLGRRTLLGSRKKLHELASRLIDDQSP